MDTVLRTVLSELASFGASHDAQEPERRRRMLNITPETGPLLSVLVRSMRARCVLELGTSNGYSTLWLADAVRDTGGRVTTVEQLEAKAALARESFRRGGVETFVELQVAEVGAYLQTAATEAYDFVFLDTDREQYVHWWPDLRRVLVPGGLLVVDNVVSHTEELAAFMEAVRADPGFTTALVPVGNGELLAHKPGDSG